MIPPEYVGERLHDAEIDESFVVVNTRMMRDDAFGVITMYADGTAWDKALAEEDFSMEIVYRTG